MSRISELPPRTGVEGTDEFELNDPTDPTLAPTGTNKRLSFANFLAWLVPGIDHTQIQNVGTNSHAQIDNHIADGATHFTEASIDHGNIAGTSDADSHPTSAITGLDTTLSQRVDKVQEEGVTNVSAANTINFTASGDATVTVTDAGGGIATVDVFATPGGEANISTTPALGASLTMPKVGVDNQMRAIQDTASVAATESIDNVTLNVLPAGVDHDQLLNFNAAEHFTEASIDHTNIANVGTNTHAQIDTHIANITTNPHAVTAAQVGAEPVGSVNTHNTDNAAHNGINALTTDGDQLSHNGTGYIRVPVGQDGYVWTARPLAGAGLKLAWEPQTGGGDMLSPASMAVGELYTAANTAGTQTAAAGFAASDVARLDIGNTFSQANNVSVASGPAVAVVTSGDNAVGYDMFPGDASVDGGRFQVVASGGDYSLQALNDAGTFQRFVTRAFHDGTLDVASGTLREQGIDVQYPTPDVVASGSFKPDLLPGNAPSVHITGSCTITAPTDGVGAMMFDVEAAAVVTIDGTIDVRGSRTAGKAACALLIRDAGGNSKWHWGSEQP